MLGPSSSKNGMRDSSTMYWYFIPVTVHSGGKEDVDTFCWDKAQKTFNLGLCLVPSVTACELLFFQILALPGQMQSGCLLKIKLFFF